MMYLFHAQGMGWEGTLPLFECDAFHWHVPKLGSTPSHQWANPLLCRRMDTIRKCFCAMEPIAWGQMGSKHPGVLRMAAAQSVQTGNQPGIARHQRHPPRPLCKRLFLFYGLIISIVTGSTPPHITTMVGSVCGGDIQLSRSTI